MIIILNDKLQTRNTPKRKRIKLPAVNMAFCERGEYEVNEHKTKC